MQENQSEVKRGVVTLTLVVELPGPMPTEAQYDDDGALPFLEMVERREADLLFAGAEPGVTEYARAFGASPADDVPSEWAPES